MIRDRSQVQNQGPPPRVEHPDFHIHNSPWKSKAIFCLNSHCFHLSTWVRGRGWSPQCCFTPGAEMAAGSGVGGSMWASSYLKPRQLGGSPCWDQCRQEADWACRFLFPRNKWPPLPALRRGRQKARCASREPCERAASERGGGYSHANPRGALTGRDLPLLQFPFPSVRVSGSSLRGTPPCHLPPRSALLAGENYTVACKLRGASR